MCDPALRQAPGSSVGPSTPTRVVSGLLGEYIGYPEGDVTAQYGMCVWVRKLHDGKKRGRFGSSIK